MSTDPQSPQGSRSTEGAEGPIDVTPPPVSEGRKSPGPLELWVALDDDGAICITTFENPGSARPDLHWHHMLEAATPAQEEGPAGVDLEVAEMMRAEFIDGDRAIYPVITEHYLPLARKIISSLRAHPPKGETPSEAAGLQKKILLELEAISAQREEIGRAFLAKYGCAPEEVEQVIQHTAEGTTWFVRRLRPAPGTPIEAAGPDAVELYELRSTNATLNRLCERLQGQLRDERQAPPAIEKAAREGLRYLDAIFSKREDSNPVVAEFLAANFNDQEPGFTKWAAGRARASLSSLPQEQANPWMFPKKDCDLCCGTGFYGDRGPGRKGNREFIRCDCTRQAQEPDDCPMEIIDWDGPAVLLCPKGQDGDHAKWYDPRTQEPAPMDGGPIAPPPTTSGPAQEGAAGEGGAG